MSAFVQKSTAIVTASFGPDLERCRLLCETIDRHVTGYTCHYILVETADVALFKTLETPRRKVIDEKDLLPSWLRPWPDPFYLGKRRIWLSLRTKPLRGWHAQQLRRMAVAEKLSEDAFFYCDSDVAFLRPFDCATLWKGDALRLFRRDNELKGEVPGDQHIWAENAGRLLAIPPDKVAPHGYVGTLIAWRRDVLLAMCRRIEEVSGRHWVEAIGKSRRFSECTIYGQFAEVVMGLQGHFVDTRDFCEVFWFAPVPTPQEFSARVKALKPEQVAIGVQSFLGADIAYVRSLVADAKP
ncbi:MAG: DUF6492 family protein [Rhizobiaceae bacterium]